MIPITVQDKFDIEVDSRVGLLPSGVPCSDLSGFAGIVPAECGDLVTEWAAHQCLKEVRESWMGLEVRLRHDQVIPRCLERDEIQVELLGSGANTDSHLSVPLRNSPRDVDMR